MTIIIWQQFGLKKNPYNTKPLIEGGDIPIEKAFVGREKEREYLTGLLMSEERLSITLCGNVGVGKTSLTNYIKYAFKYHTEKMLFSARREIEAHQGILNKREFILEIIGSVIREISLIDPDLIKKNPLLSKLVRVVDISQSVSFAFGGNLEILGTGGGGSFSKDIEYQQPPQIPVATLEQYLKELIDFIKTIRINGRIYQGLIVHVNNFDIVMQEKEGKQKIIQFFHEIRDLVQTDFIYFIFIGPKEFYKDIIHSQPRIKGAFHQTPLLLDPLTKTEIATALDERIKLLTSDGVKKVIKPFDNEVIYKLYDLYNGDVRTIMAALRDILNQYADRLPKTLTVDEAMILLGREKWLVIERNDITEEQKQVLRFIIENRKPVSQKEIAALLNKAPNNVSGYYFAPLKNAGVIEEISREGKVKYWYLTQEYRPLENYISASKAVRKKVQDDSTQLALFE